MEEWKQIEVDGKKLNYEVSTKGRVRNLKGEIISPFDNGTGYLKVNLYVNSKCKKKGICS